MNRKFKVVWNVNRGQYIVTNEKQKTVGKASKVVTTLALATFALLTGASAPAAYTEQGKIGSAASWESAEYQKDWGLAAMNSSKAYALGFHGQNVAIGVMDSGALLQAHPELAGSRFSFTHVTGRYTTTGNRYPGMSARQKGEYRKGDPYDVTGNWTRDINDSHGTHVTGTVGANRDGSEFHGVSWGSNIIVGNTGGTDSSNYGPFLDPGFFFNAWDTLAEEVNARNQGRGGVINNSFGTNIRIKPDTVPQTEAEARAANALMKDGRYWVKSSWGQYILCGRDGGMVKGHFPTNLTEQTEYEYFLFNNQYGTASDGTLNKNFVDSAWEAVKDKKVVQVFTTGNRDNAQPFFRALYPYFNPEAEKQWIAVAGLRQSEDSLGNWTGKYELIKSFNEAGNAKWWTVVAPGMDIYSSVVVTSLGGGRKPGDYAYASWGGTSMAAPHVSGAFGVLMSRYGEMDALQVREVLLTTARHTNPDGSLIEGWDPTLREGQVSDRLGWGVPDLEKGMYGPGQLLGEFNYNMRAGSLDVWSNNISQVALEQRKEEDIAWLKQATGSVTDYLTAEVKAENGGEYILGGFTVVGLESKSTVSKEDAKKWRQAYYDKRAEIIREKLKKDMYNGSLIKNGKGTLVLSGENTYEGKTTVLDGTLLGFTESFGKDGGHVEVNGGRFGLLSSYNDQLTLKGNLVSTGVTKANVTVNAGGTLLFTEGQDAKAGKLSFKPGSRVFVAAKDLKSVYKGKNVTVTLSTETVSGLEHVKTDDSLAFFETSVEAKHPSGTVAGTDVRATLARRKGVTMTSIATTENGRAIGAAIESAGTGEVFNELLGATRAQVASAYNSLGSDAFLNAQNASIVNTLTMTRAVQDQAMGRGGGRTVDFVDGSGRLWATGIDSCGSVDYGQTSIDNNFYAGFIGCEVSMADSANVGVFFGAGRTKLKGGTYGKIKSKDIHVGLYGVSRLAQVAVDYGVTFSKQDRNQNRTLAFGSQVGANATSAKAKILQFFAECAYTGFDTNSYSVEPFIGFNWLNVKTGDFTEKVGNTTITTHNKRQNLQVSTLGVRGAVPFMAGNVAMSLKGRVGWSHFFGDAKAKATLGLGGSGFAVIKGGKLKDQANVGLGIDAQLTKATTFGVSYIGAFDGKVKANGVLAKLRISF